jgi:hypothetical protein
MEDGDAGFVPDAGAAARPGPDHGRSHHDSAVCHPRNAARRAIACGSTTAIVTAAQGFPTGDGSLQCRHQTSIAVNGDNEPSASGDGGVACVGGKRT